MSPDSLQPRSIIESKQRLQACKSEDELRREFYELYENALRSRDYYNGALRKIGENPYKPNVRAWGFESGTSFDEYMKELTETARNKRLELKISNIT